MPAWLSILPPLLAILIAVWKKDVILALVFGIWLAEAFLVGQNSAAPESLLAWPTYILTLSAVGFTQMLERIVGVFQGMGDTRVLLFGLLVGALIELMQRSGGVMAFVQRLTSMGLTSSKRRVSGLPMVIGMLIFVETSMSCLAAGVTSQKLFDRFGMSRARLAFIVDSTCAPISVLILFNGWGAYLLGLIEEYQNPVPILIGTLMFNFYPLLILSLVLYTVVTSRVFGPMRHAESIVASDELEAQVEAPTKSRYVLIPMAILIVGMFFFMWYTGDGDTLSGSGSSSVLWSVCIALFVLGALLVAQGVFSYKKVVEHSYTGMGKLLPVVMIMLLSFAIGASCKALGTGTFVAGIVGETLPPIAVAPLLFISAGIMSFTTGTSWGTFAILIPVGMPLGMAMGIPLPFVMAAILGGGVFGDHCSPISDTTLIASLASGCDHLEHVRTQLPYALTAGVASILLYLVAGLFLF